MEITRVNLVYFSPTQTTRKTLRAMASVFSVEVKEYDITLNREIEVPVFGADELVIAGVPVYGGRIPLLVESFFQSLKADHTPAAVVGVYGNRHYDDAVLELADYLQADGLCRLRWQLPVWASIPSAMRLPPAVLMLTIWPRPRSSAKLFAANWRRQRMLDSSQPPKFLATAIIRPEEPLPTPLLPRPQMLVSSAASV